MASYRKIHLFDLDIPGKVTLKESNATLPGQALCAVPDTPAGTLGLSVCYDLRFPSLFQRLRFDLGADVLLIPAAFTVPTGEAHWEARAQQLGSATNCRGCFQRVQEFVVFLSPRVLTLEFDGEVPRPGRSCC